VDYLVFKVCERVIISILVIRYYDDDYYNLFISSKFYGYFI